MVLVSGQCEEAPAELSSVTHNKGRCIPTVSTLRLGRGNQWQVLAAVLGTAASRRSPLCSPPPLNSSLLGFLLNAGGTQY